MALNSLDDYSSNRVFRKITKTCRLFFKLVAHSFLSLEKVNIQVASGIYCYTTGNANIALFEVITK